MEKPIPTFEHPELDGKAFFLGGNEIGVLLIHGFTATTVEVSWLAKYLHEKGFTVSTPLLPGHGTTPEDLNDRRYSDWTECVDKSYLKLREKCNKVLVGGESMGAVLSLFLAEKYSEIAAVLLYSPAIKIKGLKYSKYLKFLKPILQKGNYDDIMPWQGYTVYPLFAANEFLSLQKLVIRDLYKVKQPTLIFQGAYDKTIDTDCSEFIISRIASSIKKTQMMVNSGHVILLDQEFNKAADETLQFIEFLKIL